MTIVVFDVFGTLVRSNRPRNPYARLLRASPQANRDEFLTTNRTISQTACDLGLEHLTPVLERELHEELAALDLFPDVLTALSALHAAGRRVAICSNLAQPYGEAVRALLPRMDGYFFSYEIGARKPDPAIYARVCSTLRCQPKDVLFIGDSLRADVEGPRRYGMRSAHLDRAARVTIPDLLRGI